LQKLKTKYRKKTRELLMRLIFQMSAADDFSDEAKEAYLADTSLYLDDVSGCIFDEASCESPDMAYFEYAFQCVRDNLTEIDAELTKASQGWAVQRMGSTDRAVLRVAAAELMYIDGIDAGVSINEAVLLAKKYGTEKSASFVNGVLGTIARRSTGTEK